MIATSGYIARGDVPSGTNFLPKPFSASDLVNRVRQVAAERAAKLEGIVSKGRVAGSRHG